MVSSFPEQGPYAEQRSFREQGPFAEPGVFAERGADPARSHGSVDLDEASRQLELAAHDIAVAASCIGLGDLDEAHTNVITARAAADAAEEILRVALASGLGSPL